MVLPAGAAALGERIAPVKRAHSCAQRTCRATDTPSSMTNCKGVTGHHLPLEWAGRRQMLFFSQDVSMGPSKLNLADGCSHIQVCILIALHLGKAYPDLTVYAA
jgi:hypothetical protein